MSTLLIGVAIGALVFGGLAVKSERVRVASRNVDAAKAGLKAARSVFWRAISALFSAAAMPLIVVAVLVTLYLIGERNR